MRLKRLAGAGACLALALAGAAAAFVFLVPHDPYLRVPSPLGMPDSRQQAIDWDHWLSVNPAIVAWVRVEGTQVDYPVVQAPADDPGFYLNHDVYGEPSEWGCPYVDASCAEGIDSPNVVVLAHNMNDGSMFAELAQYHNADFAAEHPAITLYYPDGERHLQVTSARTIPGSLRTMETDFVNKSDFADYKRECFEQSGVQLVGEEDAAAIGRMYTFCTCSYFENPADERTLVYARETI